MGLNLVISVISEKQSVLDLPMLPSDDSHSRCLTINVEV